MDSPQAVESPPPSIGDSAAGYRLLPQNVEAEQALLGAILVDNDAYDKVSTTLEPAHFHVPVHGRIYEAARKLIQRGHVASPLTLKAMFEGDEGLVDIGGAQYLNRLARSSVSIANAQDYGRVIVDLSRRRELIRLGESIVDTAYDPTVDRTAGEQVEDAENQLFHIAEDGLQDGGFKGLDMALAQAVHDAELAYKREGKLSGVGTGLIDLDNLLGGLHRSDLVILAGRPSMGKTALATNIAFHAAVNHQEEIDDSGARRTVDGAVVGFFSLEMSAEQLATRILAEDARISSDRIRRGKLSDDDFLALVTASQKLSTAPLYIDDLPALSIPAVRTRARRLKRTKGLSLIVIDYLQLLRPGGNQENRVQEISEITRGLKAMAKDLNVPVLALSQLSRAVEQREDKRPMLSDLRESGTIEQDADVVMFIYRHEYYLQRQEPQERVDEDKDRFNRRYDDWQRKFEDVTGKAEVIVAKQRHGPIGKVELRFEAETTKFSNLAAYDRLPDSFG